MEPYRIPPEVVRQPGSELIGRRVVAIEETRMLVDDHVGYQNVVTALTFNDGTVMELDALECPTPVVVYTLRRKKGHRAMPDTKAH